MSSFLAYCINTVGYLRLVTISDLVDIAILTFLFYKLIGLFRRTNAAKVARAVLDVYKRQALCHARSHTSRLVQG